jgi:hypothetical protein
LTLQIKLEFALVEQHERLSRGDCITHIDQDLRDDTINFRTQGALLKREQRAYGLYITPRSFFRNRIDMDRQGPGIIRGCTLGIRAPNKRRTHQKSYADRFETSETLHGQMFQVSDKCCKQGAV